MSSMVHDLNVMATNIHHKRRPLPKQAADVAAAVDNYRTFRPVTRGGEKHSGGCDHRAVLLDNTQEPTQSRRRTAQGGLGVSGKKRTDQSDSRRFPAPLGVPIPTQSLSAFNFGVGLDLGFTNGCG